MKSFIYPEMLVHVPLCTHKLPKNIVLISNDSKIIEDEINRYRDFNLTTTNDIKEIGDDSCNVLIIDLIPDASLLAHANRLLNDDGLMVMQQSSLDDVKSSTILMQILGTYFKIIMPYYLEDGTTLLLASREYHPTADVILQRADLIDGLQYYNCDIHISSFAMPNYIRKNYLGVIKN